jgi:hypothetical protein
MSITNSISDKLGSMKDNFVWQIKFNSIGNALWMPYFMLMRRERGQEFPFYLTTEVSLINKGLHALTESFDDFVNCHEMEKNRDGDFEKTLTERLRWVLKNFHIYSNDTMSNMYFTKKLPARDYQRLKYTYNQLAFLFLVYNTVGGVALIALNNFIFRTRKVSVPLVAVASVSTMLTMTCNYHLSYYLFDSLLNNAARRLGHGSSVHRYNTHFKRNLEFTSY